MTTEQEYSFQGWVTEIDNARNYRPLRVGMKDSNNQTQWFGTFDIKTGQMLEQAGINSGPWSVQYIMKPWTGQDGIERHNYNIKSIAGGQAPQVTPPQTPTPMNNQQVNDTMFAGSNAAPSKPIEIDNYVPDWVASIDDRGRSIIRQVAFKDVLNKDDKSLEEIARLTDAYEAILLCMFEPESSGDDSFIQQDF